MNIVYIREEGKKISSKRILQMDVIRGAAIIAVVLIHVSSIVISGSNPNSRTYSLSMIINQVSRFSVPAFILISGMGLTISYKKDYGYFKFIGHRFNKILPSYVLWCLIYIYFTNKNFQADVLANNIIYGKVFYHFYYIPLIVQFYIVYPFIYRFIGKKCGVLITFLIMFGMIISTHYFVLSNKFLWFFDKKNLLDWIFYFSVGAFIGENLEKFLNVINRYKAWIFTILFISTCGMIYEAFYGIKVIKDLDYATTFMRPTVVVYSIFIILCMFTIPWKEGILISSIKYVSKNSYFIYLSHAIILYYFTKYYLENSLPIGTAQFGVEAFAVTLVGPIVINELKRYL